MIKVCFLALTYLCERKYLSKQVSKSVHPANEQWRLLGCYAVWLL
jgi:hypothetical protein